eukprot:m.1427782 g.1427782  ORF g.1427782 m.1427782 type:complete len:355 (-) comp25066_c0_seq17:59-1123(-)
MTVACVGTKPICTRACASRRALPDICSAGWVSTAVAVRKSQRPRPRPPPLAHRRCHQPRRRTRPRRLLQPQCLPHRHRTCRQTHQVTLPPSLPVMHRPIHHPTCHLRPPATHPRTRPPCPVPHPLQNPHPPRRSRPRTHRQWSQRHLRTHPRAPQRCNSAARPRPCRQCHPVTHPQRNQRQRPATRPHECRPLPPPCRLRGRLPSPPRTHPRRHRRLPPLPHPRACRHGFPRQHPQVSRRSVPRRCHRRNQLQHQLQGRSVSICWQNAVHSHRSTAIRHPVNMYSSQTFAGDRADCVRDVIYRSVPWWSIPSASTVRYGAVRSTLIMSGVWVCPTPSLVLSFAHPVRPTGFTCG